MSYRFDSGPLLANSYMWGDRGLGILGSEVPSTGEDGASFIYNDLSLPADNDKEYYAVITSSPAAGTLTIYSDSSFDFTGAPDGAYSATYELYEDGISKGTGTIALTVGGVADTTPDAFSFTDQTDVALSTLTTSNTITVTGIDSPATITVTGGEMSINSGAFTSVSTTVSVNDAVQLRQTSSGSNSTQTNVTLDIGGVSDVWSITTEAAGDAAPVITMNGSNPMFVDLDGSYSEPGATATDDIDGDLTGSIIVGGDTVNPAVLGTYTVTYTVTDSGTNQAQVSRSVVVRNPAAVQEFSVVESPVVGCVSNI